MIPVKHETRSCKDSFARNSELQGLLCSNLLSCVVWIRPLFYVTGLCVVCYAVGEADRLRDMYIEKSTLTYITVGTDNDRDFKSVYGDKTFCCLVSLLPTLGTHVHLDMQNSSEQVG